MTGQKNRFTTTEKLWNLDDKQLKTPKHDALVLWLMDNWKNYVSFPNDVNNLYFIKDISILSEKPIYSSPTFLAGYIDISIKGIYKRKENGWKPYAIVHNIEVKPVIDSFGAVLRQLNSYKGFYGNRRLTDVHYYLFTLDNRFDSQFESQGITVLHPPSDFDLDEVMEKYGLK